MKKNNLLPYLGLLVLGILLGWFFFGRSSKMSHDHEQEVTTTKTKQLWTCSMHPQIMQPEPGDCPICGMDLIPAEAGADGLTADQFKLTENAMALANIETTVLQSNNTQQQQITLSGKIVANENAQAVQASYFSGRIERLNINTTGEVVNKGQLLASIYAPELYAAQQELITAASLKESQPALYKAVRNKLKLWKLSENQINTIEQTKKVQEYMPVYATVSGTVTEKMVTQGDYVKQGQPLLKIANLNSVWASFDVYENQISAFKEGQEVAITTNAYSNKIVKGTVDFIDPVLNNKTRTVKLRVVLSNKEAIFKPGMFVKAQIAVKTNPKSEQILTIPTSAVLWTGKRSVVYLKTQPNAPVFEMREVMLGTKIGDEYEVLDGLFSGNEIVTNGTFTVDAAAQLQGKRSMMNQEGNSMVSGHEGHGDTMSKTPVTTEKLTVPKKFQVQLTTLYQAYLPLKDALVKDNVEAATNAVLAIEKQFKAIDMKLLKDEEAHNQWMNAYDGISKAINTFKASKTIDAQRKAFKPLSETLAEAIQIFGITEKTYLQFCPMAANDAGAYWLSNEEQIRNPYFGDAMLKCGEVTKVIE